MAKKIEIVMSDYFNVLEKVKERIVEAQYKVMTTANVERNILYWRIGKVIVEYSQWGVRFVENLSKDLMMEYPNAEGYSVRNLNYMKQFALRIPSEEILHQVGAKISWKAIKRLIDKTDNLEEHLWYTKQCIEHGWSSTVLVHQIESSLYKRQALADKATNFKERLMEPLGEQAEEIIKDPYIFDFIPAAKKLKETELENALVQQITKLLLEFGSGFAFMGQQYPITVGSKDFFIDLLFYNVKLHCYFVVELKTVEFEPEFAGKLSFYLSAIDGELRAEHDNPTIGLLLCKGKDKLVAEYALKDVNKPMGISEYKLSNKISDELKESLPAIEDIESRINK
ncbi:PDDEXK nuclease domain-containing protein [Lacrimispora brassicae]